MKKTKHKKEKERIKKEKKERTIEEKEGTHEEQVMRAKIRRWKGVEGVKKEGEVKEKGL